MTPDEMRACLDFDQQQRPAHARGAAMTEWEFIITDSHGHYGGIVVTAADAETARAKARRLLMRADGVNPRGALEPGFTLQLKEA